MTVIFIRHNRTTETILIRVNPLDSFLNITMSMCIAFTLNIKEDTYKLTHINLMCS